MSSEVELYPKIVVGEYLNEIRSKTLPKVIPKLGREIPGFHPPDFHVEIHVKEGQHKWTCTKDKQDFPVVFVSHYQDGEIATVQRWRDAFNAEKHAVYSQRAAESGKWPMTDYLSDHLADMIFVGIYHQLDCCDYSPKLMRAIKSIEVQRMKEWVNTPFDFHEFGRSS